MSRRILVLMGGRSSEREVSLVSGAACAKALAGLGHTVDSFDAIRPVSELVAALAPSHGAKPEVVFNALHGRYGEDGNVQGLLNLMGVPYTHSGLLASAIAMDKPMAKVVMAAEGLPVPEGRIVPLSALLAGDPVPRPYVAKPPNEGSSVGVHIVHRGDNLGAVELEIGKAGDHLVLVERFIPGRELTVGVMGEGEGARAFTVTEIRPRPGMFYDYDAKYSEEKAALHVVPAEIPENERLLVMDIAVRAHRALGCRGVSRTDLRYDDSAPLGRRAVALEVNTQPGMTPMSLVPEQAAHCGISFGALCAALVEAARCDG